MIMDFCISLSTKQSNSGRLAVTQADWIVACFSFSRVPDATDYAMEPVSKI